MFEIDADLENEIKARRESLNDVRVRATTLSAQESEEWEKFAFLVEKLRRTKEDTFDLVPSEEREKIGSRLCSGFYTKVFENPDFLIVSGFDEVALLSKVVTSKFLGKSKIKYVLLATMSETSFYEDKKGRFSWSASVTIEGYQALPQIQTLYKELGVEYSSKLAELAHKEEATLALRTLAEFA